MCIKVETCGSDCNWDGDTCLCVKKDIYYKCHDKDDRPHDNDDKPHDKDD
jgi:hypothetical protein